MGLMDKVKSMFGGGSGHVDKAKDLAADHGDKIKQGVDKTTDVADDKTGGKFSDPLQKADEGAANIVDGLDDKK
jgi:MT0933-like antitoxin protein